MKLNQNPVLRTEDYPTEQEWISRLFVNLNPFIQAVNQFADQNVDFSTNIKAVTREYEISTFQEFSFLWPHKDSTPADVRVIKASKTSQETPTILLLAWEYSAAEKTVTVTKMVEVGLSGVGDLSGNYKFTVRATV